MLKALDFLQEAWLPKDMLKALDFLQEAWLPTDMLKALDFLQEAWLPKNDTPPPNRDQVSIRRDSRGSRRYVRALVQDGAEPRALLFLKGLRT